MINLANPIQGRDCVHPKCVYNVALHPAKALEPAATPEPAKVNTQGQYWTVLIAVISVIAVITAIAIAVTVTRRARIK